MAGDWIKFELTTLDKPEVCQIADAADIDPDAAVGKLMRVWGWFDQQTEKVTLRALAKVTRSHGRRYRFLRSHEIGGLDGGGRRRDQPASLR